MQAMPKLNPDEIELRPDAWERFRRAVHAIGKSKPQHRQVKPLPGRSARKKRGKGLPSE